jgi:hypothetical protein
MFDILEYIPIINFIWQIIYSITVYLKLIYKLQLLLPLPTESIKILQRGDVLAAPLIKSLYHEHQAVPYNRFYTRPHSSIGASELSSLQTQEAIRLLYARWCRLLSPTGNFC